LVLAALLWMAAVSTAQEPNAMKPDGARESAASAAVTCQTNCEALTAEQIMARVAENQDRAEKLRAQYVYEQRIHIVSKKPHGHLEREETAEFHALPGADGTEKKLIKITGEYRAKGKYASFEGEPLPDPDSIDAQLIRQFRDDLANSKTKDGMAKDLFPLTSEEQKDMAFRLVGEEARDGRPSYRIAFWPKDKDEYTWAGDAWIDKEEFAPVEVITHLSHRLPLAVRTMLGTDVPGLGFSVRYRRQEEGVWFPSSFGTEFRLRVLFFLNRDLAVSLDNKNFERTHVQTRIEAAAPQ
jgi:hypothetical protein